MYKCIINGIFEMAYKNGVIFSNPCNEMSIDRNLLRSERPKESKLRIFYINEIKDILLSVTLDGAASVRLNEAV